MTDTVKLAAIMYAVASEWGVTVLDLKSARRERRSAVPRQAYYHIAIRRTAHSYPEVARHCGNRDHTTALHGVRVCEERLKSDPAFAAVYERVTRRLPDWNPPMRESSRWTADRTELLRQLWNTTTSDREIARVLGMPASTVRGKAARMGLGFRPEACSRRGRDLCAAKPKAAHKGPQTPKFDGPRPMPSTTLATYLSSPPAVEALPPAVVSPRTAPPTMRQSAATVPLPVSLRLPGEREGGGRPCQWILDRDVPKWPGKPTFCGAPVIFGESWCPEHRARCFIPKAERKVDKGRLERLAAAE